MDLARRLCCAPTIAYRRLIESLHFVSEHLEWAPHDLTTAQNVLRVEKSNGLSRFIKPVRNNSATLLITLDGCRPHFGREFQRQWLSRDEPFVDSVRSMSPSPKVMLTVVWNTQSFHIVGIPARGVTFDIDYHRRDIFLRFAAHIRPASGSPMIMCHNEAVKDVVKSSIRFFDPPQKLITVPRLGQ
jgi:hypothetical protein